MKSYNDQTALNVLIFLAHIQAWIGDLRRYLREEIGLADITSFVESRYYGNDLYLSICVEAKVDQQRSLTWWIDIRPFEDSWGVEASISWNGRTTIHEWPELSMSSFDLVQQEVRELLVKLMQFSQDFLKSELL